MADDSFGRLEQYLDEVVALGVPGIVLHVAHDNRQWAGASGFADVEREIELQPGDSFPIFSVSKTLTAAVTLQLVDEGRLSMTDILGDLLPGTEDADRLARVPHARDATVRQLLNHSSGFYDYGNSMAFLRATVGTDADFSRPWTIDDLLAFAEDPENAPTGLPGQGFSYTSTGYLLLGLAIEAMEKKPLEQVMAERLFEPLQMNNSYLTNYADWRAPDVTGYVMTNADMLEMGLAGSFPTAEGNLVNSTAGERSRLSAGRGENGVVATAESLMVFATAVFDGELFSAALLNDMTSPQDKVAAKSADSVHNYGLGLHLFDHGEQRWAMMMGNGAGGEAAVGRELNSGLTFVVLTNGFGMGTTERTMEKMRAVVQEL
jgi:D-alanyl-D-alanine carboxypeptidase